MQAKDNDLDIKIVIIEDQSCKYDLGKGIYTVFFMDKKPTEIAFKLSDVEKNEIVNSYYDLTINKINEETDIEANCLFDPQFHTILQVKTKTKSQNIRINESCDAFASADINKAEAVQKFLNIIMKILNSKAEIKNAPRSSVMYM